MTTPPPARDRAERVLQATLTAHGLTTTQIRHIHFDDTGNITIAIEGPITHNLAALQQDIAQRLRIESLTPPFQGVVAIPSTE